MALQKTQLSFFFKLVTSRIKEVANGAVRRRYNKLPGVYACCAWQFPEEDLHRQTSLHISSVWVSWKRKICLVWGLLLVAAHKADFRWPLPPWHVINAAHGDWTERTSVFIRGI